TSRDAQPGPRVRAGTPAAPPRVLTPPPPPQGLTPHPPPSRPTPERCGHDCSRGSSPLRSLVPFSHHVLNVRQPVLRGGGPAAAPHPGETGSRAGSVERPAPGAPRGADYARLTDVRLRTSMESAHGLFMAEGEKVIRRAVAAGFGVRSMLVTRDKLAVLADLAGLCPGPVYVVSQEIAEQVTGYQVHRGALASMARRALPTVASLLSGNAPAGLGRGGGVRTLGRGGGAMTSSAAGCGFVPA